MQIRNLMYKNRNVPSIGRFKFLTTKETATLTTQITTTPIYVNIHAAIERGLTEM